MNKDDIDDLHAVARRLCKTYNDESSADVVRSAADALEARQSDGKHGIVAGSLVVHAVNDIHARDMVLYGMPFDLDVVQVVELGPGEFEVQFLSGDEDE